jgi:hypothetical protein
MELHFVVLDKVVAQGTKRLESMFATTFEELKRIQQQEDTSEDHKLDIAVLMEAYELTKELIMTVLQFKDTLRKTQLTTLSG